MSQSFTNLLYHLIFSTKQRRPLIKIEYQSGLYNYIGGIIRRTGGISLGINGTEDHVHVLAKLRPDRAAALSPASRAGPTCLITAPGAYAPGFMLPVRFADSNPKHDLCALCGQSNENGNELR